MKRKIIVGLAGLLFSLPVLAGPTTLLKAYSDAQKNDPTFKAAEATYMSTKTKVPQAFASLLPQLTLTSAWNTKNTVSNGVAATSTVAGNANTSSRYRDLQLNVTQDLFNFASIAGWHEARASAKAAAATFAAAAQSLIQRVTVNYFNVLQAQDILRFQRAKKTALKRTYDRAQQRYKVGLDTITDVYEAQANYDSAVAATIADNVNVKNDKEKLREITGHYYKRLAKIRPNPPLVRPRPYSIKVWTQNACQKNLDVKAARYDILAARDNIKENFGGHLPTLAFAGNYTNSLTHYRTAPISARARVFSGEIDLSLPLFSGGSVSSQVSQAEYDYNKTYAEYEKAYRSAVSKTHRDYNSVIAAISQLKADKQAIKSSRSALKGAKAEFEVGTKIMLDVLTQQENLFNAQSTRTKDLYNYINNTIKLKQDVGQLSIQDLKKINTWLQA